MKEKHSFNRKNRKPRRERAVGGVEIYIELSQESSRWAKIQNLDIVWWAGHCSAGTDIVWLDWTLSDQEFM
jgi:hypothetical protein